jgi:hypothetical protein
MKTWDPKLAPPHLVSAEATVGSYLLYYASTKIYDSARVLVTWAATVLNLFFMLEISTESKSHHVNTHRPFAPTHHFRSSTPSRMFWRKGREREREREFNLVIVVGSQSTDAGSYSHLPTAHPFIHSLGFLSLFFLLHSLNNNPAFPTFPTSNLRRGRRAQRASAGSVTA